jgi:deoxyadenosine/deoxycytidine kinase
MKIIRIISIDGNIGSGKSTILEKLKEYYSNNNNVVFLKEPVDEWENIRDANGVSILEKFYACQDKYAFSFQMMAYISRLKIFKESIDNSNNNNIIYITERSLFTDKMVFAKMLYDNGKIEDVNYQIYNQWFDVFANEYPLHKIIYIKTSPNVCYSRVHIRARTGEEVIPLDYLINCDKYHDNMISELLSSNDKLVLDGNIDMNENNEIYNNYLTQIDKFIY